MKNPLISVVMPHFNATSTVASSIMSIRTQTYENWELIIVDDGSDDVDELMRVVARYNDPRMRVLAIGHGGIVKAQMAGHRASQGQLQAIQAADDLSMPDRLEKAIKHFRKHPNDDVYVHGMYINTYSKLHDAMRRTYKEPFKGVVHARMAGYKDSKGELIAIQDADDASLPDRLEKAVRYFATHDIDVYCHGLMITVVDKGQFLRTKRKSIEILKESLLKEQGIVGVPIFKRHVIEKCPLREETSGIYDWSFHLDWMFSGFKYGFEDIALYEYVRRENSLSERNEKSGVRARALETMKEIMKKEYNVEFAPYG